MPSKNADAKRIGKRTNRVIPFLTFVILKGLCSLVMLNFYMGSQISISNTLEDSLAMMMHRDANVTRDKLYKVKAKSNNWTKQEQDKVINDALDVAINQSMNQLTGMIIPNLSDGTLQGKERIWNMLQTRNVAQVDAEYWASIPTWDEILKNIHHSKSGDKKNASPIIHGLETCQAFQNITSSNPWHRRIAPAGIFNTGTNYLSVLLEYNCQNPHRVEKFNGDAKRGHGNEWEVPWGKHNPAHSRGKHFKDKNPKYTVDEVLPIVLVRNPFGWMKSMCRNPYTASWKGQRDQESCPQLKKKMEKSEANSAEWNNVDVRFGSGLTHHQSLGHLWNDWYGEYFHGNKTSDRGKVPDAPFPRLMIRFEDIIFFPYEVTKQVCECAGGVIAHRKDDKDVADDTFHYVVRSAKAGMGHGPASQRNGLIDSWARYGREDPKDAYSKEEASIVNHVLDPAMMDVFGYR